MTRQLFTKAFWADATERAIKTAAQTAVAVIGASALDVLSADWLGIVSASAGGALLSVLSSVASAGANGTNSPSLVK